MKFACMTIALLALVGCAQQEAEPQLQPVSVVALLRERSGALSEWQKLILAIAVTESRCDPQAVGSAGDRGILQQTPIYTRDAARLTGTDYTPEDAHDIAKALAMFDAVQGHYNPTHDTREAIRRHNPGAGPGYARAVLDNLELITRYEAVRAELMNH